ncbi:FAD-dependent monooxygenase [Streptomyces sp. NBC_00466]|uniref:FAD-dependent monooxygenase n=1 Tax=Streptomyces sp. NBC_00466 TaxID=2903655 RepID=UPI0030E12D47
MEHVVIAGGGPTGLWLAAELRLGGIPVTVLETRRKRDPHSKALTIHPRTLEVLATRGVLERFLAEGRRIPSGHFGGLDGRMDFGVLDTPYPFTLALPQARTEELLEEHGNAAGAQIRRGHQVTGLTKDEDGVSVEATGPDGLYTLRADYIVGCDGTRSTVREAAGIDFPGNDATTWLSRFGNAARRAAEYRRGRVLLAGDAAHMHYPAGGVGLNVGVQDATNLGWKLAATVAGTAPAGLLDSYHTERHPVGADLLLSTRAQTALMNAFSAEGQDLRALLSQLISTVPEFSRSLAEHLSALAVTYPAPAHHHPLTGHRAPNLELSDSTDLFTLLRTGRHVLLNFTGTPAPPSTPPHIITHAAHRPDPRPAWSTVRAALIRPDGHVAWASEQPDAEVLRAEAHVAVSATHR